MASRPEPQPPRPVREGGPYATPGARVERSAGGVVVRITDQVPRILLIRDPYRRWGLPKGHLENGERASEAALREVREETGLDDILLGPDLGEIDWTFRLRGRLVHKFCRFFLMSSERGEVRPEVEEGITACRWLTVQQAMDTIGYENARGVVERAADRIRIPERHGLLPWIWEDEA
jgi:ADP-ribose pyrophosphatase YjhB (NUDIX family)